jgi:N-acetylmuramoyl-L-alanine amidase
MARLATLAVAVLTLPFAVGCGSTHTTTTTTTTTDSASVASVAAGPVQTTGDPNSGGSAPTVPTVPTTPPPVVIPKPHISWDPIPFGAERKAQMVAYVERHYGSFMKPTYKLKTPHVIVIHFTETPTFQSTYNTFAPDTPDPELHELPNTCAHFVIDQRGGIHQLVPLGVMCRHTVGLNWTAIGIEHVGYSDQEVLGARSQMAASLRLVRWLRCRYHIAVRNVIGHNESLSSPYHREDVPALRVQTHSDFNQADMRVYRRRLAAQGGCA